MPRSTKSNMLFVDYYYQWIETYKKDNVANRTWQKYLLTHRHLTRLWPQMKNKDIDSVAVQRMLNRYGEDHEKETIKDFYNQVKKPLERLFKYDEVLKKDPTWCIEIPAGKEHKETRVKYLENDQLQRLIKVFEFDGSTFSDGFMIILRTGMRFAEFFGVTPQDVDFDHHLLTINKTWNYQRGGAYNKFMPTKNKYSVRKIAIDEVTENCFRKNMGGCAPDESIFATCSPRFNSTWNQQLSYLCRIAGLPRLSIHSLRHEVATFLASQGASSMAIAERLGHADDSVTRKVYIHRLDSDVRREQDQLISTLATIE